MADITITASGVLKSESSEVAEAIAGAAIAQGEWLYADAADSNKLKLAQATTLAKSVVVGMAITGAAAGQPVKYLTSGEVTVNGLAVGDVYVVSATAGKMCLRTDLVAGNFVTILGGGKSATNLRVSISALSVAVP